MTTTEPTPVPEGRQPLFLSFAIALPLLDALAWLGSPLADANGHLSARPDLGSHGALICVAGVSVALGLLFCIISLMRRESLRVLGVICLLAYIVAIALIISPLVCSH